MIFVVPWLIAAALFVLWSVISYKLSDRYPRYYAVCGKIYDNLPKIVAGVVICAVIYFALTGESTYYE